jgi:hypothetical protein
MELENRKIDETVMTVLGRFGLQAATNVSRAEFCVSSFDCQIQQIEVSGFLMV